MLCAGKAQEQHIALPDHVGNGSANLGTIGTQARQGLRRQVECDHALAALLHEIAADRLAHHTKPDEADSFIL